MNELTEQAAITRYKDICLDMLQYIFPANSKQSLEDAVDYSISKRFKNSNISIQNSYTHQTVETDILNVVNYILTKKPIITSAGVMWMHHGEVPNPFNDLLQRFIDNRIKAKAEMFKHPVGSEMYTRYDLIQLLAKVDANALYGALGRFSCMFYNLNVAESTTTQGRSYTSAALLFFESFLANNVKFGSLNEIVTFIHNVTSEKQEWKYNSKELFGEDFYISPLECWYKIMSTCGFFYVPKEKDLEIVYNIICNLTDEERLRLFFKNHLYGFFSMPKINRILVNILAKLEEPFLNPNKAPDVIKEDLDWLVDVVKEYVYYGHQYIDRLSRVEEMIRDVVIITDTDSTIVSLDPWYNFTLDSIKNNNIDIPISHYSYDALEFIYGDEFGVKQIKPIEYTKSMIDYSFIDDEIITLERVGNPLEIIPQDGLRHSIINIMSYICGKLILDYMERYTKNSYSYDPETHKCMIIMKNEFLFKRLLATDGKKNYANVKELREGHVVPNEINRALAIMGLPIDKSTLPDQTRDTLKRIMYEDVLNCKEIDQLKVLKDLIIFEKTIIKQLKSGDKSYFKPATVKAIYNYEAPERSQGIKASIAYNALRDKGTEALDLDSRNAISIIKTNINRKNISDLQQTNPEKYEQIINLMNSNKIFDTEINAVALPLSEPVPKWIINYIDYTSIINDNLKNFPLDFIGLYRFKKDSINYSNILRF